MGQSKVGDIKMKVLVAIILLATYVISAQQVSGQQTEFTFQKVEVRTSFGAAQEGKKGLLLIDNKLIHFTKKNARTKYFTIPTGAITEVFYSRVSGRRIGAAILVSPLLLFTKGRKHYLTLSFNDGKELVGAIEFKLHKSNYRAVLRTVEQITGLKMAYDQEGVKDTRQAVASRRGDQAGRQTGVAKITSNPDGAEIEIDGAFIGISPRNLKPGEYMITARKKDYGRWERKISIEVGDVLEIHAELDLTDAD